MANDRQISRRSVLEYGLAGLGLALAASRARAAEGFVGSNMRRARAADACIFLFMRGGQSQLDTWDPKPGTPNGGPFAAIETATAGIQICEHLPAVARVSNQLALLRSLQGTESNHESAVHLLHTSYRPEVGAAHAPLGSIAARDFGDGVLPGYVAIGGRGHPAGLAGSRYLPYEVRNPRHAMEYLRSAAGLAKERFQRRKELWRRLEDGHLAHAAGEQGLPERRHLWEQALALMSSPLSSAFDLQREPRRIRESYGEASLFGQGCLLARRLVEHGVPFVEVVMSGWDKHDEAFPGTRALCHQLDLGLSALIGDLQDRGLLRRTLVVCVGEFGRSPKINDKGGRDHYPSAFSAVLAGARVPGGQVIGATSEDGVEITERPVTVPDFLRTIALKLGLNPDETHMSERGRPITTIEGGEALPELS